MAIIDLGSVTFSPISARSHAWENTANKQFITASVLTRGSAISRTVPVPATASDGDTYISPSDDKVWTWFGGDWYTITPNIGMHLWVADANELALFDETSSWVTMVDLPHPDKAIPRELSFYAPGFIRDNQADIFRYAASMEFTVAVNAPGSSAFLEVAPSSDITFTMKRAFSPVGTFTFLAGSTVASFNVPVQFSVMPTAVETTYSQAQEFFIEGPVAAFDCQGLSVTISGFERAL